MDEWTREIGRIDGHSLDRKDGFGAKLGKWNIKPSDFLGMSLSLP